MDKRRREKLLRWNRGAKSARINGALLAPRFCRRRSSLVHFLRATTNSANYRDCLHSSPPFLLRNGQQHVSTCLNISFRLNLLATGSWYTALGQELILSKMSFSLSSDTGNKLKTKMKNSVISQLPPNSKRAINDCACPILDLSIAPHILFPRGRACFGQHQESRPLGRSNTESPRFTDFPSLCICSESSLTNLIDWGYETNSLFTLIKSDLSRGRDSWCWPRAAQSLGARMSATPYIRYQFFIKCLKSLPTLT